MRSPKGLIPFALPLVLASCAPGPSRPRPLVVFPPAPDTPRIQFLVGISEAADLGGRPSLLEALAGQSGDAQASIIKPFGVSIASGKIYVCDTVYRGVAVIDLERRRLESFRPPDLPGRMRTPVNCFADERDGHLYVTDTGRRAVFVFDSSLEYVGQIGGADGFRPNDAFVDDSVVWVTDASSHRVRVYDRQTLVERWSFPDAEPPDPAFLHQPTNLHVTDDRVYVTDFGAFQVKVYDRQGRYLMSIGGYGDGLGQFARPKGVAVDRRSRVYVADAAFNNVQVFNSDGDLLLFFGGSGPGPGSLAFPAQVSIDYEHLEHFRRYVDESFDLEYLILIANQYGPAKVSVYGFVRPKGQG